MSQAFISYLKEVNPEKAEKLIQGFDENVKQAEEHNKLEIYKKSSEILGEFIKKVADTSIEHKKPTAIEMSDLFIRDSMLKMARLEVFDTTPEGIEQFLKEYMMNDLSFFPDKLNINVNIVPLDIESTKAKKFDPEIKNATGTVDINYKNALIQIPFVMRDKEILPFDTIQVGMESTIYSRENMKNILFNLKILNEKTNPNNLAVTSSTNNISSYVGVDKPSTLLTDNGFMTDMIQIQSLIGSNTSKHVYSSLIEELLEKTANIKEVDINYPEFEKELLVEYKNNIEKEACEDTILEKAAFLKEFNEETSVDIQIMENGDFFVFTERDGDIVTDTTGVVFKHTIGMQGPTAKSLVVTADGRFKVLYPGEGFVLNLSKTNAMAPVKLHTRKMEALNEGGIYSASIDKVQTLPFMITKRISGGEKSLTIPVIYHCMDLNNKRFTLIPGYDVSDNQIAILSKDRLIGLAAEKENSKNVNIYNIIFKKDIPIISLSETTEFIPLKKGNVNNITSTKDVMRVFDGNLKLASYGDRIALVPLSDKDDKFKKYTLIAVWVDKRTNEEKKIELSNAPERDIITNLRNAGYNYDEIATMIHQADTEGFAEAKVGLGKAPWKMDSKISAGIAVKKTIEDIKNSLFSKNSLLKGTSTLVGGAAGGFIADDNTAEFLRDLKTYAAESKALAKNIEKLAIEKENDNLKKIASLMVIKHRIDNLLADALEGKTFINTEVLAELHEVDPYLSKIAYDLVELKTSQALYKNEIISPNVITGTLRHLDGLHKYALAFKRG